MTRPRYERSADITLPLGCVAYESSSSKDNKATFTYDTRDVVYVPPYRAAREAKRRGGKPPRTLVPMLWEQRGEHAYVTEPDTRVEPARMTVGKRTITGIHRDPRQREYYVTWGCACSNTGHTRIGEWRNAGQLACIECTKDAVKREHVRAVGLYGGAALKAANALAKTIPLPAWRTG